MNVLTIVSWVFVVAGAVGLGWLGTRMLVSASRHRAPDATVSRWLRHPAARAVVTAWMALSATSAVAWLALSSPHRPVHVQIRSPNTRAHVNGSEIAVSGTVSPADARVVLLVSPESRRRWWVQGEAVRDKPGEWSVVARLGTPDQGRREAFELLAVATAEPRALEILAGREELRPGQVLDAVPLWDQSDVIIVWRAE